MAAPPQPADLEALSRRFHRFATLETGGSSPLYERLCLGISQDADVLALAAQARSHPVPNILLAAVHYLLLKGVQHPLAAFYPSVSNETHPGGDPYPHFRAFCIEHRDEILNLIRTRLVQTNEVHRCAYLALAFGIVAERAGHRPLALIDVGTSAGLNLLWDRFGYDYGRRRLGDPGAPVQLTCELRGVRRPPIPERLPAVASRAGIDLSPVDVRDPDAVLWFRALIWPEHRERVELLMRAIQLARQDPPELIAGDALELLPQVIAAVPRGTPVCVFHTHTANQFPREAREQLIALIEEHGRRRDVYRVSAEWIGTPQTQLELVAYEQGVKTEKLLAYVDGHARWIEWLDKRLPTSGT
ncbi:MAG TPA: DUF2332 domain-containing protein [Anaerolineae bacterium]|nr:DUF2332 domain-containing protein [Anaerolineae bacterium]